MKLFSYTLARDIGLSPNPFDGYCTLAIGKPAIKNRANIGDWILGTGSYSNVGKAKLIFAMEVTEKIDYNEYWNDERFLTKKPNMNGSLKVRCGDNFYWFDGSKWHQEDSMRSFENGIENLENKKVDLRSIYVLISDVYYYFGKSAIELPIEFNGIFAVGQGYKSSFEEEIILKFTKWLINSYSTGLYDEPFQFGLYERILH